MKLRNVIVGIVLLSSILTAADKKFSLSFRCGYYQPSSSTYNNGVNPAINANLNILNAWLIEEGLTTELTELGKMSGKILFGGELEFFAVNKLSVAVGAQVWQNSLPQGSLHGTGTIDDIPVDVSEKMSVKASLIPITVSLRAHYLAGKIGGYIGGGAGWYMGKVIMKEEWNFQSNGETYDSGTREIESKGSSILPHINAGFKVNLMDNIALSLDARYPLGKIKSFTIKRDTGDPAQVGQKLTFIDIYGEEKQFKWELSGVDVGLNLLIRF
ncbi:MAG: hypothetical protein H5U05_09390 [Candidatus Aminicenantes bacterium]|nr:hypothetical protein [Candidatus Aminicenantes bacterium]